MTAYFVLLFLTDCLGDQGKYGILAIVFLWHQHTTPVTAGERYYALLSRYKYCGMREHFTLAMVPRDSDSCGSIWEADTGDLDHPNASFPGPIHHIWQHAGNNRDIYYLIVLLRQKDRINVKSTILMLAGEAVLWISLFEYWLLSWKSADIAWQASIMGECLQTDAYWACHVLL